MTDLITINPGSDLVFNAVLTDDAGDRENVLHQLVPMQMLELWQKGAAFVSAVYARSWAIKEMDPSSTDVEDPALCGGRRQLNEEQPYMSASNANLIEKREWLPQMMDLRLTGLPTVASFSVTEANLPFAYSSIALRKYRRIAVTSRIEGSSLVQS